MSTTITFCNAIPFVTRFCTGDVSNMSAEEYLSWVRLAPVAVAAFHASFGTADLSLIFMLGTRPTRCQM
jgi:hypothetical protein